MSHKFGKKFETIWETIRSDFTYPGNFPSYMEEYAEEEALRVAGNDASSGKIQCLPLPGPFLPCQDLFDWWTLRCGVWIVFLCAMLGNGTVVFVLIFSRGKMDVPRFLVCNLAAADFFMGIYLGKKKFLFRTFLFRDYPTVEYQNKNSIFQSTFCVIIF
jgi:leucine-rich repeat-containing G protein-coupled receptor 6